MANTTITNLPTATSLTGSEELNVVQSNTSKSATVGQIGAYVNSTYPAPGVSSVATSAPITGGTITSTGTIGLQAAGVSNTYLANMAAGTVKANVTGGFATPSDVTPSALLDTFGSTQGMTLYRGNTSWAALPSSGTNTLLSVSGPNANPAWQTLSYMIDNAINSASVQGSILYRGATSWAALGPGLAGQKLQTSGAGANPVWSSSGAGSVTQIDTGTGLTGGPITLSGTISIANTGVVASAYGSASSVPVITVNAQGQLTSVSNTSIAISASQINSGVLGVSNGGTGLSTTPANGALDIGNGTNFTRSTLTAGSGVSISNGSGSITISATGSGGTVTSVNVSGGTTGLTTSGGPVTSSGTITLGGTLGIANGGTGQSTASAAFNALSPVTSTGDLIIGNGTNSATRLAIGSNGYVLTSNGTTATWAASTGGVTSFQTSLSGLTPNTSTTGAVTLAGTLGATSGGTGQSTYATGDILYASASNTLSKLTAGTNGYVLTLSGGLPTWAASTGGVTSFSAGSTGLTPSTATTGAITLSGTLAVANGGTGVTASSGANSVVLRDASSNITGNAFFAGFTSVAASGTTITLTAASTPVYVVTGSGGQVIQLPNATTLSNGTIFSFNNNQSSGAITINNASGSLIVSVPSGGYTTVVLLSNATSAGSWDRHDQSPSNVSWSTNTLDYPGSITSATWNGATVAINRGGTGQTTASAAFNALSPVTSTGDLIIGNGTNSATRLGIGTNGYVLTSNGTTASWSAIPSSGGGTYTRTSFTATGGQTSFTVTYTVGYVQVYLNGVLLNAADYTATSGTAIVLAVAASAGDIVEVIALYVSLVSGVSVSGTPTAGQIATWVNSTTIQGTAAVPSTGSNIFLADYFGGF